MPGLGCRDLGGDKLKVDGEGLSQSGGKERGQTADKICSKPRSGL